MIRLRLLPRLVSTTLARVLLLIVSFSVTGCDGVSSRHGLEGSWATPVKEMHLHHRKWSYVVYTFRRDGKVEVLTYDSVVPTIPGDYKNHMLLLKDIGTYTVSGDTISLSGLERELSAMSWQFQIQGSVQSRIASGQALSPLTKVPYVSRAE